MVHQHKGDGHGQAKSEQETVHAVYAEVSWVCRNGALHAGGILEFYIFPDWHSTRCPQQSGPIAFLILIALIGGGFTNDLIQVINGKWSTTYNASQIISGIFASGIFAVLVYTVKSVFSQYILKSDSRTDTDKTEEQSLLSVESDS